MALKVYSPTFQAGEAQRQPPQWLKEYSMKGDLYDFLFALGHRESENKYEVKNKFGYMGRWQFGKMRLYDLGYSLDGYAPNGRPLLKVITWDEFKSDSLRQDMAVLKHVRMLKNQIKNNPKIGQEVLGIKITLSGCVATAHLKGIGGLNELLSGKDNVDGLGTKASSYMELFGDYELAE